MRPIAGPINDNPRPSTSFDKPQIRTLSRRSFAAGLAGLVVARSLIAQQTLHRIVSTAPSITEALFALGLGDKVVGVSQYCDFPPEVARLPKVGSYVKPNLEAIARLTPDLVVLQASSSNMTDRLKALRIPYIEVPHGTLNDVFTGIQIIAKSAGIADRASALVDRIQSSLQNIRAKSRTLASPSVVAIVDHGQGTLTDLTAVGPDNYINEILQIAGSTNVLVKAGLPRYPHISMETLIRENPDVILDLTNMEDSEAKRTEQRSALLSLWQQNQALKAARNGRVYFGTSNVLLVPGPRAPEAAELLFNFMHDSGGRTKS